MAHILAIAPHPDDEVLGCGGALCHHADRGERVSVVFLTSGERGLPRLDRASAWETREREARAAAAILGISDIEFLRGPDWVLADAFSDVAGRLAAVLSRDPPNLVYLPHPGDEHPDHRISLPLVQAALAAASARAQLRGYEIWAPLPRYDCAEDISDVIERKLHAMRAYASQLTHYDYVQASLGLSRYRGELAMRCRHAEVFKYLEAVS